MTLVYYEHTAFFLHVQYHLFILRFPESCSHLLDRSDDQSLCAVLQVPDKRLRAVCRIYAPRFKTVVFLYSLVVEVLSVDQKEHPVDVPVIPQKRRQLIRCESLSGTCRMEDISVQVAARYTVVCQFHRVYLIRTHDHKDRLGFLDDEILRKDLRDGKLLQEVCGECRQLVHALVFIVGPVKDERLQDILRISVRTQLIAVCTILCLYAITQDEDLDITEQAPEAETPVPVYLVHCLIYLDARPFQFNLDKRKSVDQYRHIIPVLVYDVILMLRVHCDLVCDLVRVQCLIVCKEPQIDISPVIKFQNVLIPEQLRGLVYRVIFQVFHDPSEFGVGKECFPLDFIQFLRIDPTQLFPEIRKDIIVCLQFDIPVPHLRKLFYEYGLNLIFRSNARHIFPPACIIKPLIIEELFTLYQTARIRQQSCVRLRTAYSLF